MELSQIDHDFTSTVVRFLNRSQKCTVCSNRELLIGFNDLKSKFPSIALEWAEENDTSPENHRFNEKTNVFGGAIADIFGT